MANFRPNPQTRQMPTAPAGRPIASYRSYAEAQQAVDFLSDEEFEVQHVTIVGTDLRMVERVLGRLTYGRVALGGLFSGAWIGLLIGLLLLLLAPSDTGLVALLPAIIIGAAFGIIFSLVSYALTRGRRDFTSVSQIVASRYAVFCTEEHAGAATQVLQRNPQAASGLETSGAGGQRVPVAGQPGQPGEEPGPQPGAGASQAPQVTATGPTYSEMIARQRDAERHEAEQDEDRRRREGEDGLR